MLNDKNLPKAWAKLNDLDNKKFDKTGGTITGALTVPFVKINGNSSDNFIINSNDKNIIRAGGNDKNSVVIGNEIGAIYLDGVNDNSLFFRSGSSKIQRKIYHEGNKPSPADIGAINRSTDTMYGPLIFNNTLSGALIQYNGDNYADALDIKRSNRRGCFGMGYGADEKVAPMILNKDDANKSILNRIEVRDNSIHTGTNGQYQIYHQGFKPTATDVGALPNVGYGNVHELGRYLDLHLAGSTADFDTRIATNSDKSLLIQNINGYVEIGPKNGSHCHFYTDRNTFYFNKELIVNDSNVLTSARANTVTATNSFNKSHSSSWIESKGISFLNLITNDNAAGTAWKHTGTNYTFTSGVLGNNSIGFCVFDNGETQNKFKHRASLDLNGNFACSHTLTAAGDITGARVFNAVWNDYAEYFPKLEGYKTEPGDIIALSLQDNDEYYELATETHNLVVGVHSDQYGHLIGGEHVPAGVNEEFEVYNNKRYIPVGLVGRLPVKFTGEAKKGIKVVPSNIPGVGRAFNSKLDDYDKVIGYIVENNNEPGIRKVKIKIGK